MPIKRLKKIQEKFIPKGSFKANVLILMIGTAVSQVMLIAISPILSRIFSPEDFGIYGVYAGIIAIVSSVVALNYELAILLPKHDEEAINLVALSVIACLGMAVLSGLIVWVVPFKFIYPENPKAISSWIWILPVSVITLGILAILEAWCTRKKLFQQSSWAKILRSFVTGGYQIFSGYKDGGSLGLIFGAVLGTIVASVGVVVLVMQQNFKTYLQSLRWKKIRSLAKRYIDFPVYSSSQNLLNAVSISAPAFFLTYFYGVKIAGFYLLGIKLIQVPADLVSRSFRQVFYQKAAEVHNEQGDLYQIFKRSTIHLLMIAIVPSLIIFFFAPMIFKIFLGQNWETAGEYSRWLVVWIYVNFANVPAICCYRILNLQSRLFQIYFFYLIFRVSALLLGGFFFSAQTSIVLFSAVGLFFNIFIILYIWKHLDKTIVKDLHATNKLALANLE